MLKLTLIPVEMYGREILITSQLAKKKKDKLIRLILSLGDLKTNQSECGNLTFAPVMALSSFFF